MEGSAAAVAMSCTRSEASSSSTASTSQSHTSRTPDSITGAYSDVDDRYESTGRIIGRGHRTAVRECVDRTTGARRAVKSIRKGGNGACATNLHREVTLMGEMDHANIARLIDVREDEEYLHLVTDLFSGGELFDRIVQRKRESANSGGGGGFTEAEASGIMRQVLSAISHMHDRDVVHRDIKPENIVFETPEPGSPLRIIDFGLARKHYRDSFEANMSTVVGSSYFVAPEVLAGRYDRSCDLWSAGVTAYVLLSGKAPFDGRTEREVCAAVRRGKAGFRSGQWKGVSPEAKDFVRGLLRANPRRRMTAREALEHPWITRYGGSASSKGQEGGGLAEEATASKKPSRGRDSLRRLRLSIFRI